MQTECPHCHTLFRLDESLLQQADGQVRCGHCLAVFTADNPYNTPTYIDQADDDEENTATSVADVIPPELRAETRAGKSRLGFVTTLLFSLATLTAILALAAQYTYYNRHMLVKQAELRPWIEKACSHLPCQLPEPRDTRLISLSSKNIYTHPNSSDALMVSATIINQADFAQRYPVIELRFENIRGETIAGRRFHAHEYLGIPVDQISMMQPQTPVSFNLEIRDPGNDMVSYEFAFL